MANIFKKIADLWSNNDLEEYEEFSDSGNLYGGGKTVAAKTSTQGAVSGVAPSATPHKAAATPAAAVHSSLVFQPRSITSDFPTFDTSKPFDPKMDSDVKIYHRTKEPVRLDSDEYIPAFNIPTMMQDTAPIERQDINVATRPVGFNTTSATRTISEKNEQFNRMMSVEIINTISDCTVVAQKVKGGTGVVVKLDNIKNEHERVRAFDFLIGLCSGTNAAFSILVPPENPCAVLLIMPYGGKLLEGGSVQDDDRNYFMA